MTIVASDPNIANDIQLFEHGHALVIRTGGQLTLETGAVMNVGGVDVTKQLTGGGNAVEAGTVAVVGSVAVVTGLTAIKAVSIDQIGSVSPGVSGQNFTYAVTSGGTIEVYAWMPTSSSNPTLIANTGTATVGWTAIGTGPAN